MKPFRIVNLLRIGLVAALTLTGVGCGVSVQPTPGSVTAPAPTAPKTPWYQVAPGFEYQYQLDPDKDPVKWAHVSATGDPFVYSQVRNADLGEMSTAELATAVLTSHYRSNLLLHNSYSQAIESVTVAFNGLRALLQRPDVADVLLPFYCAISLDDVLAEGLDGGWRLEWLEIIMAQNTILEKATAQQRAAVFKCAMKNIETMKAAKELNYTTTMLLAGRIALMDHSADLQNTADATQIRQTISELDYAYSAPLLTWLTSLAST
ncbi:MAG: hypothetical protein LBG70_02300 [Bifidobacteriaceae bacterium]|jgi:hypothetical protein|nr:hypothetical protein [Bifidobacteriaceae bacterium]